MHPCAPGARGSSAAHTREQQSTHPAALLVLAADAHGRGMADIFIVSTHGQSALPCPGRTREQQSTHAAALRVLAASLRFSLDGGAWLLPYWC